MPSDDDASSQTTRLVHQLVEVETELRLIRRRLYSVAFVVTLTASIAIGVCTGGVAALFAWQYMNLRAFAHAINQGRNTP